MHSKPTQSCELVLVLVLMRACDVLQITVAHGMSYYSRPFKSI